MKLYLEKAGKHDSGKLEEAKGNEPRMDQQVSINKGREERKASVSLIHGDQVDGYLRT